jgi:ParB/RepB/Spo0J family partition protein
LTLKPEEIVVAAGEGPIPLEKTRQESFLELSQLQPVRVRRVDGHWELIDGRRTWLLLKEAGQDVLAFTEDGVSDERAAWETLTCNMTRSPSPMLEAAKMGYLKALGYAEKTIAKRLGVSTGLVCQRLALLQLHPLLQDKLQAHQMTVAAARYAARLPLADQETLAELDGKITVDQAKAVFRARQAQAAMDLSLPDPVAAAPVVSATAGGVWVPQAVFDRLAAGETVPMEWGGKSFELQATVMEE